jgi:hypothetical protein
MLIRKMYRVLAALPLLAACASAPMPAERMASAESAVRAAKEVGSDQVPKAQLMVKLAEEQIAQAKQLAKEGETDKASSLLTRATADAELALAMAREEQARASASKPQHEVPPPPVAPTPPAESSLQPQDNR